MSDRVAARKRRQIKACTSCRRSKLRCDGRRPCTRCATSSSQCIYHEIFKDQQTQKIEELEKHIARIEALLSTANKVAADTAAVPNFQQPADTQQLNNASSHPPIPSQLGHGQNGYTFTPDADGSAMISPHHTPSFDQNVSSFTTPFEEYSAINIPASSNVPSTSSRIKREYRDFEIQDSTAPDVVTRGEVTLDDANSYFHTFVQGCHNYVPVLDLQHDTFESVRARSSVLFDSICAVGCRAMKGQATQAYQELAKSLKERACEIILSTDDASIEIIQALMIISCYSEKGWLLIAAAIRKAADMGLALAYESMANKTISWDHEQENSIPSSTIWQHGAMQMRYSRVWLALYVLENIFSLDGGRQPRIRATRNLRRCRSLLDHPSRTPLDLRLLAQVELNAQRASAQGRISALRNQDDGNLLDLIKDVKVDLDIWLSDWTCIVLTKVTDEDEKSSLMTNLEIQRCWAEIMLCCKALQSSGIDNVAAMSDEQRAIVLMTKESAYNHLQTLLLRSQVYLSSFRYTTDFVWAKCAFSVMLLLKLATLFPESSNLFKLLADSRKLLDTLSDAHGPENIYYQILSIGVDKWDEWLTSSTGVADPQQQQQRSSETGSGLAGNSTDVHSYVPKEFVSEWDFPGLKLCYIPMDLQDLFAEFTSAL